MSLKRIVSISGNGVAPFSYEWLPQDQFVTISSYNGGDGVLCFTPKEGSEVIVKVTDSTKPVGCTAELLLKWPAIDVDFCVNDGLDLSGVEGDLITVTQNGIVVYQGGPTSVLPLVINNGDAITIDTYYDDGNDLQNDLSVVVPSPVVSIITLADRSKALDFSGSNWGNCEDEPIVVTVTYSQGTLTVFDTITNTPANIDYLQPDFIALGIDPELAFLVSVEVEDCNGVCSESVDAGFVPPPCVDIQITDQGGGFFTASPTNPDDKGCASGIVGWRLIVESLTGVVIYDSGYGGATAPIGNAATADYLFGTVATANVNAKKITEGIRLCYQVQTTCGESIKSCDEILPVASSTDFGITKSLLTSGNIKVGDTVEFSIVVENLGVDGGDFTVTDLIPSFFSMGTLNQTSLTAGTSVTVMGNQIVWTGTLAPFGSALYSFELTIQDIPPSGVITNFATVTGSNPDPNPDNNEDSADVMLTVCVDLVDVNGDSDCFCDNNGNLIFPIYFEIPNQALPYKVTNEQDLISYLRIDSVDGCSLCGGGLTADVLAYCACLPGQELIFINGQATCVDLCDVNNNNCPELPDCAQKCYDIVFILDGSGSMVNGGSTNGASLNQGLDNLTAWFSQTNLSFNVAGAYKFTASGSQLIGGCLPTKNSDGTSNAVNINAIDQAFDTLTYSGSTFPHTAFDLFVSDGGFDNCNSCDEQIVVLLADGGFGDAPSYYDPAFAALASQGWDQMFNIFLTNSGTFTSSFQAVADKAQNDYGITTENVVVTPAEMVNTMVDLLSNLCQQSCQTIGTNNLGEAITICTDCLAGETYNAVNDQCNNTGASGGSEWDQCSFLGGTGWSQQGGICYEDKGALVFTPPPAGQQYQSIQVGGGASRTICIPEQTDPNGGVFDYKTGTWLCNPGYIEYNGTCVLLSYDENDAGRTAVTIDNETYYVIL